MTKNSDPVLVCPPPRGPGAAHPMMFGRPSMLLAPAGDGGGGGGGAGGGSAGLSQDGIDQINAIVTSRLQKFDFSAGINAALEKAMAPLTEKMTTTVNDVVVKAIAAASATGDKGDDKGGKGKDKSGGGSTDADNKLAALEGTIAAMKADAAKKDEALALAAKRARDKTVTDRFKATLGELKVRPELAEAAELAIAKRAGDIQWGEGDEPKVKVKRDKHGHQFEEMISPEDYAKEWADTKEGKGFIAAPGGRPTGGRPTGGTVINRSQGQQQQGQQNGQQQRRPAGPSDLEIGNMVIDAYRGAPAGNSDE